MESIEIRSMDLETVETEKMKVRNCEVQVKPKMKCAQTQTNFKMFKNLLQETDETTQLKETVIMLEERIKNNEKRYTSTLVELNIKINEIHDEKENIEKPYLEKMAEFEKINTENENNISEKNSIISLLDTENKRLKTELDEYLEDESVLQNDLQKASNEIRMLKENSTSLQNDTIKQIIDMEIRNRTTVLQLTNSLSVSDREMRTFRDYCKSLELNQKDLKWHLQTITILMEHLVIAMVDLQKGVCRQYEQMGTEMCRDLTLSLDHLDSQSIPTLQDCKYNITIWRNLINQCMHHCNVLQNFQERLPSLLHARTFTLRDIPKWTDYIFPMSILHRSYVPMLLSMTKRTCNPTYPPIQSKADNEAMLLAVQRFSGQPLLRLPSTSTSNNTSKYNPDKEEVVEVIDSSTSINCEQTSTDSLVIAPTEDIIVDINASTESTTDPPIQSCSSKVINSNCQTITKESTEAQNVIVVENTIANGNTIVDETATSTSTTQPNCIASSSSRLLNPNVKPFVLKSTARVDVSNTASIFLTEVDDEPEKSPADSGPSIIDLSPVDIPTADFTALSTPLYPEEDLQTRLKTKVQVTSNRPVTSSNNNWPANAHVFNFLVYKKPTDAEKEKEIADFLAAVETSASLRHLYEFVAKSLRRNKVPRDVVILALIQFRKSNKCSGMKMLEILGKIRESVLGNKESTEIWDESKHDDLASNNNSTNSECPICYEDFEVENITILPCLHKFHKSCIEKWFRCNNICPICRKFSIIDEAIPVLI